MDIRINNEEAGDTDAINTMVKEAFSHHAQGLSPQQITRTHSFTQEDTMRFFILTAAALAALFTVATAPVAAAVSVSVSEPNFFGRIDIGGYPPPRLMYEQPIIVRPVKVWSPPIYLRVRPGHAKNWDRYCNQYGACGRPVYFVDDAWYRDVYVPRYREDRPGPKVYHVPPPPPSYYEYRRDHRKPGKKIYIEQDYYQDQHKHRKGDH